MKIYSFLFLAVLAAGCGKIGDVPVETPAEASGYVSPEFLAASPAGKVVYVTCATAQRVMAVSLDGAESRSWKIETTKTAKPVPVNPSGIAAASGGGVWVTCGVQGGELQLYGEDGTLRKSAAVGHSPCAPVASPDGRTVYVLNRFSAKISAVDVETMSVAKTWSALREPFVAAFGAGGKLLFVANMLPFCASTNDVVAAAVTVLDVASGSTRHVLLPNGSTGVRGLCASPDGRHVYVTHTMGRYQLPTTQLERGWMNTAALSVFDGVTELLLGGFCVMDKALHQRNRHQAGDIASLVATHAVRNAIQAVFAMA